MIKKLDRNFRQVCKF